MPRSTLFEVCVPIDEERIVLPGTTFQMKYTQSKNNELTDAEVTVVVQSAKCELQNSCGCEDEESHDRYNLICVLRPIHPIFIAVPGASYSRPISIHAEGIHAKGYLSEMLEPHFT